MTTQVSSLRRVNPVLRLAALRRLHVYVGALIAPSILFFACTGALQLFDLHEARGDYQPPPVVEKLSMVHKDQVFLIRPKRPGPAVAPGPARPDQGARRKGPKPAALALKWWFLSVAAGLTGSTLLGLWMALRYGAQRKATLILLLVGAAIPATLAILTMP